MRLFTAIDIPEDVKEKLRDLLHRLQPLAKLSWSSVDKLHVTTKFIGEWPEERLEELKRTLSSVGSPGPIEIAVRGLGWFPNAALWAGVSGGEPLKSLAAATEQATACIGVPAEVRVYSPHLTLARIKVRTPLGALRQAVAAEESDFGSFRVQAFYLYLSTGGKYTRLAEFPLT